ncbi:UDP-2-acetamido-2,6-beta-L-arabino-hexul-4-ose reductase [Variovorax sp. PBL-E5]|uniref:UDP-2-acetamido-2,6-beta-L-arabino-hexul-4-ose reductase n=1 Tax=Variovorax sp. PBL-E5 TaxID=434014 RepID=UPI001316CAB0|nr:capsular polysaccharide biosynthesis protein CapF [Variovorax sp. PBL-E5]VTU18950.1 thioester reductase domain protein [Variovorax sp. PBL-E5]
MRVLVTGADGFIGKNLRQALAERQDVEFVSFEADNDVAELPAMLQGVDFVFHLAGVNRPQDPKEFAIGNRGLTEALCDAICRQIDAGGKKVSVALTSSIQAAQDNPYGQSKLGAEQAVIAAAASHGFKAHVFRLPNVFGKWCRPNYNSAVATFCHNVARGLPITVRDPAAPLTLVYIDDLVARFIQLLDGADAAVDAEGFSTVAPQYTTTVGEIADLIQRFRKSRETLVTERVGSGLVRALYSTYVSALPVEEFKYAVPSHGDPRGVFVEMLRTPDSGQFSYFTAHPGITRGGHYHHSKTEKFLVIKGRARFKFRQIQTQETYELVTSGDKAEIVETVPGWTHDITNIGDDEMVVMLWANELFDRERPDTFACPV